MALQLTLICRVEATFADAQGAASVAPWPDFRDVELRPIWYAGLLLGA